MIAKTEKPKVMPVDVDDRYLILQDIYPDTRELVHNAVIAPPTVVIPQHGEDAVLRLESREPVSDLARQHLDIRIQRRYGSWPAGNIITEQDDKIRLFGIGSYNQLAKLFIVDVIGSA